MTTTFLDTDRSEAAWSAVYSMALCVALLIGSEFMPVSLLTPMADSLGVTGGQAGQSISVSGLFAVLSSLVVTTAAGGLDRRLVLLAMTGLMLTSLVMVALAPSFAVLMVARALLGVSIGSFWALAASVLMRLVPERDLARAISVIYGGQAVAAAFAAPIGSFLGEMFGWRAVFWMLTPIVASTLIWQMVALPPLPAGKPQNLRSLVSILHRPYFRRGIAAVMLSWGSAFAMFTYLRPFIERVTGADVTLLSGLLLMLGIAGFVGTWAAGKILSDRVAPLLRMPALIMGACTLGLLLLGQFPVAVGILLAIWGAMNTAMSVIWMTWMSRNVEDAPEAAGSLMVAAIQISILLGAMLGGLLLDSLSITATFTGSVILAGMAVFLIGNGQRLMRPASTSEPHSP
jgi:predicted MFS family arabinose efflux permease